MSISPPKCRQFALLALVVLAAAWDAHPLTGQDFRVERLWEKGAVNGPPETVWVRIQDATILHGRVFAVDIAIPTVRAFTNSGDYIGDLGRTGAGPGGFTFPVSATVTDSTVRIYDLGLKRYVILDDAGRHVRTTHVSESLSRGGAVYHVEKLWPGRFGWSVGITGLVDRSRPSQSVSAHHLLAWKSLDEVDTLSTYDGNPFRLRWEVDDSLHLNTIESGNLGAAGGAWLMGDSLLVQVDGSTSQASLYEVAQDGLSLVRTRTLPGSAAPLTGRDRDGAVAWYNRRFGLAPDSEHAPIEIVPPRNWSAWTKVVGDDEGNVWMRQGGPRTLDPTMGERWARWSLVDDRLRWVELPPGVEGLRFREGHVVGLERGQFGVESLVLFRLVGS